MIRSYFLLALASAYYLFSPAAFAASATEIDIFVEDTDSPPYNMRGNRGLGFILLEMVQQKIPEVRFKYTYAPWERALLMVGSGADALMFASYKENRTATGVYPSKDGKPDPSKQMALISYSLFVQSKDAATVTVDGNNISGIDKTKDPIGVNKGYSIGEDLKKAGYSVEPVMKTKQNFDKLALGRLKAVAALTDDGRSHLTEAKARGKFSQISPPLIEKPYYLLFSKKFDATNHALVARIWDVIEQVRESEEYKKAAAEFVKSL